MTLPRISRSEHRFSPTISREPKNEFCQWKTEKIVLTSLRFVFELIR